ncbi:MAG: 1-acyl-sn-glycerol-3-phosphate acyltransferase [Microthrixaceae bacterium]|nr:1-acyl-sn-glycerol-3-phosphate acyltransferase [Microthrixaceae bacterium]MCB9386575.1 1-acyl-sn-glycerol-3-phosphate acyltransferase [Microthrixaceae bacterium]MCO5320056.1 1-acyl-sn-glycerol-3-phosphate acyltransferase [Microthrixaceae bacterium]
MTGAADGSSGDSYRLRAVGRVGDLTYRFLCNLGRLLAKVIWRFEVSGRERLPTVGPYILCPVHRSYVDFLVAGMAVPRRMRFMAKDSLWKAPRFGRFLEFIGAFPVDREHADRTALRRAEEAVAGGEPLVMFPEGRRQEGAEVTEMQQGPAFVACRNRVPLVPVAIGGSDRAMPIGSKMVHFAKVKVVIGEPIYPDVPLEGRVPRRVVAETTEQLRIAIQGLYDSVR